MEASPSSCRQIAGYFVPQANEIKKAVHIPVIGVGGIKKPEFADKLVADGLVDLVAVGRALWHDNEWPQKAVQTLNGIIL